MATPQEISIWVTLVPVIVGGLIGLTGGVIGPWFIESRKQDAEKKRKRAEKFEELVSTVHEHSHWLDRQRDIYVFGRDAERTVPPIAKLYAVSAVYFPELKEPIDAVDHASKVYQVWMTKAGKARMRGEEYGDDFNDAYKPYLTKVTELENALTEYAKKHFQ